MPAAVKEKTGAGVRLLPAAAAAAAAVYALAVAGAGGDVLRWGLCAAYAAAGVWLPGRAAACALDAGALGLSRTVSLCLGIGLFAATALAASLTGAHWLLWLLPALGLAGALRQRRSFQKPRAAAPGYLCLALALMTVFSSVLVLAHPAARGAVAPDHDFFWNLGNAQSFVRGFPPADLRWSGGVLTYHWLTELLAAGFSMAVGASCYDVLAFFLPAAMLLALTAVLWEFCGVWFGEGGRAKAKTGLLFALTFLGGCAGLWKVFQRGTSPFWNMFLRHLATNINGVTTGTVFLAAFAACVAVLWRCRRRALWLWATALAAFLLLTLAKGPVGGVAALALMCAAVAALLGSAVRREPLGRAAAFTAFAALVLAVFGVCYGLLFAAGAGSSVRFSLHGTLDKSYFGNLLAVLRARSGLADTAGLPLFWLVQAVCFAPFAVPLALGSAVRDVPRWTKLGLPRLFAHAMGLGGFLAFFLFDHESMSQMYFAYAGLFFANVLAADSAPRLWDWLRTRGALLRRAGRGLAALMLAVTLATGLCSWGWMVKNALAPAQRPDDLPLTAAEEEAMEWLAVHGEGRVFLTNRIHTGKALEGLSNVYSGLSGQQAYLEGFKYAVSNLGVSLEEVLLRLEEVRAVFAADTAEQALEALPEGVELIVFSKTASQAGWDVLEGGPPGALARGEEAPGLKKVFENRDVAIYDAAS